jgi:hypothetical protein
MTKFFLPTLFRTLFPTLMIIWITSKKTLLKVNIFPEKLLLKHLLIIIVSVLL